MTLIDHPRGNQACVEWECKQVHYSLRPSEIKAGMRIAICQHALRSYVRQSLPEESRFILGRVESISQPDPDSLSDAENPLMLIRFDEPLYPDDPEDIGTAMQCGIEHYARYCIAVPETATLQPPSPPGPTAWEHIRSSGEHVPPILTPEQKIAYRAKLDAREAQRQTLKRAIADAIEALAEFEKSHYPCEHGKTMEEDCFQCDSIFRQVYNLPPLADDPDPEAHVSPIG